MTDKELARERRKQRRLGKLGTNDPHCAMCGLSDWRCMELHHAADFGRDETTVIACANCHRIVTHDQSDHPAHNPTADPMLDKIGHFLLGLADMLRIVIATLYEFAYALIERAAPPTEGEVK